jgi:hypothetical protein
MENAFVNQATIIYRKNSVPSVEKKKKKKKKNLRRSIHRNIAILAILHSAWPTEMLVRRCRSCWHSSGLTHDNLSEED